MADHLLTKKKKKWVKQFKPTAVMRGKPLHAPAVIERKYQKSLRRLIDQMILETEREVKRLFESDAASAHFGQDESIASQARILTNGLSKKFDQLFNKKSKGLARSLNNGLLKASKTNLHQSLKELSGGLSLKTDILTNELSEVVIASAAENVALIKSIPEQYLGRVQGAVMRSITTGNGLKDLVPALRKYKGMTNRRAKMIAHDQTKKIYNGINRARSQAVGVKKFEWVHSGGGNEPRELHITPYPKGLDGGIFRFDDPPIIQKADGKQREIRGFPGDLPNCRCTFIPVIEFDQGEAEQ